MSAKEKWDAGLSAELWFWENYFRTRGAEYGEANYLQAIEWNRPMPEEVFALLPKDLTTPNVLDVGAGPISRLGTKLSDGRTATISAMDALADQYAAMLAGFRILPAVRTIQGEAERLAEIFRPCSFDLAYARNSLDHSYDAPACIEQILAVLKPGCSALLEHSINEADKQRHFGLHQWNFSIENGNFMVRNDYSEANITECFHGTADVTCEELPGNWVRAVLRKHA